MYDKETPPRHETVVARLFQEPQMVMVEAGSFLMGTLAQDVDELYRLMKVDWDRTTRGFVERATPQH
jgi:hypothetical protein